MAKSGSFNTTAYSGRYLTFSWSIKSQDIAANKTTISWTLKGAGGDSTWYKSGNFKVTIAGAVAYSSSARIELSNGTTVASGTYTLTHNSDGTKSFTASAEAGIFTEAVNCTGSGTFTLDTIPRASQPSCVTWPEHTQNVGNFGDTISIHMNRKSDAFTHTVRYAYGSLKGTIATGITTGTTWTIPLSFMDLIPNSTMGSGTIYVDTYSGSTLIGTKYCGFTAKVPDSVKPSCSVSWQDVSDTYNYYGALVWGLSRVKVTANWTLAYSSPMRTSRIRVNNIDHQANEVTVTLPAKIGTASLGIYVDGQDQRWRYNYVNVTVPGVLGYNRPAISKLTVHRCNEDGTENAQGEYVRANFSATVTALNNKNTATYTLRYKKSTATEYTSVSLGNLANTYVVSNSAYIFPADSSSSYDVEVEAKDRHYTTIKSTSASTAFTLMHWGADGTSVGLLKLAERANAVDIGGDVYLNGHAMYGAHGALDTRDDNETPDWYMTNHGRGAVWEFKRLTAIGFTSPSSAYGPVQTIIPWQDSSGGLPRQIAYEGKTRWTRLASSTTTWGAWQSDALIAYPIGSIYIAYNHTDPSTLFGGTWVRMTGGFLWASQAGDTIGQTGGERTHTLTVAEMPKHNHGGTYTNAGTATKTHAWLASGGSAMAYDTVDAGSGQPHNNMPPYIQVSIWRRTA